MTGPEVRRLGVELNAFDEGTGAFEAYALTYNVVDTYRTRFLPGCATESLQQGLPEVRWEHGGRRLGQVEDYRDNETRLTIIGQLDPPQGTNEKLITRAWKGMTSGTLTDFSIGFIRREWRTADDGVTEFQRIDLDEVSLVLEGAVMGAQLVATRSAGGAGPIYSRLVGALGGMPATRTTAPDPIVDEAEAILDRLR